MGKYRSHAFGIPVTVSGGLQCTVSVITFSCCYRLPIGNLTIDRIDLLVIVSAGSVLSEYKASSYVLGSGSSGAFAVGRKSNRTCRRKLCSIQTVHSCLALCGGRHLGKLSALRYRLLAACQIADRGIFLRRNDLQNMESTVRRSYRILYQFFNTRKGSFLRTDLHRAIALTGSDGQSYGEDSCYILF